jgi:hypothetical protein
MPNRPSAIISGALSALVGPIFIMLEIIAIILVVGWLLGVVSSYTLGGFIHVLLLLAILLVLWRFIRGRPPA